MCVYFTLQVPCIVVAALLNYFFLAVFCWMLSEAIMLYLMLVVVFSKLAKRWWFFLLLGWGEIVGAELGMEGGAGLYAEGLAGGRGVWYDTKF